MAFFRHVKGRKSLSSKTPTRDPKSNSITTGPRRLLDVCNIVLGNPTMSVEKGELLEYRVLRWVWDYRQAVFSEYTLTLRC